MYSIYFKNPFALKESIRIAAEVSYPILVPVPRQELNIIIEKIPNIINESNVQLSENELLLLKDCLERFSHTNTYRWLRKDFVDSICDFHRKVNIQIYNT